MLLVALVVMAQPVLLWMPVVQMVMQMVMMLTMQVLPPQDQAVLAF
jgi:hypothetical protein